MRKMPGYNTMTLNEIERHTYVHPQLFHAAASLNRSEDELEACAAEESAGLQKDIDKLSAALETAEDELADATEALEAVQADLLKFTAIGTVEEFAAFKAKCSILTD